MRNGGCLVLDKIGMFFRALCTGSALDQSQRFQSKKDYSKVLQVISYQFGLDDRSVSCVTLAALSSLFEMLYCI